MRDDDFASAAEDWLQFTGAQAVYRSSETGLSYTLFATLEQDVTTSDDHGMTTNGHMVTIPSGVVDKPARGDRIEISPGEYNVDEVLDDPGHLLRLLVSKV